MALSRRSKLVLILLLVPIALVALVVAAAFSSSVQTFAARKALAGRGGTIEHVDVGMGGAKLRGLRIEQPGLNLSVPEFQADVPLADLVGGRLDVRALVARDIVVELDPSKLSATREPAERPAGSQKSSKQFEGVLDEVELPELRVDGVELAGRVRVAGAQPLDATFALTGGGIRAGGTGKLELKIEAKAGLGSVVTQFTLEPRLDAEGRLEALGAVAEALAKTALLAEPARLRAEVAVARQGAGESYGLRLLAGDTPLVELDTRWAPGATELPGRWKIGVRDRDLAPFTLGFALPEFALSGSGELTLAGTEKLRLGGELNFAVDALETLGLPKLGPVSFASKFAVDGGPDELRVESLQLDLDGAAPVLALRTAQPFSVKLDTNKITPARAGADLAEVTLLAVPPEWIASFVPELTITGSVTGAWTVRPEGDGFSIASARPLVANGVSYASAGGPLVNLDSVHVEDLRAKRTGAGLEASLPLVRVVADGVDLVTLTLDASQKPGAPLMAKGELKALLARLADQPVLRGQTRLSAGEARVTFEASAADAIQASAQVRLSGLRAAGAGDLPEVTMEADVSRDAAGVVGAKIPLTVRNAKANRATDLLLEGTVTPGAAGTHVVAKLGSRALYVEDLLSFAAAVADAKTASSPPKPVASVGDTSASTSEANAGPLWAGITGEIELALARIVYAPGIEATAEGRVALTPEAANLEKLRALLGTGGSLDVSGALKWLSADRSYELDATVEGADVTMGPLLKTLAPGEAPKLEGTYDLSATVAGRGSDPATAAAGAAADLRLVGKAGLIRAINLDTNKYAKAGNVVSGLAGLAGALSGNSEIAKHASRVTAFNSVARALANLPYEEIVIEAKRAADGSVEIGRMRLLSPQLKLEGDGSLRAVPGRSLLEMPLNLKLELGAKGELAKHLEVLRVLDVPAAGAAADAFRSMVEPIVLDGTLGQIGTAQVSRLLSRAIGL